MMHQDCRTEISTNKWFQGKTSLSMISLLLLVGALLQGCADGFNERLDRLFSLQLRASDLPSGWQRERGVVGRWDEEDKGILSRTVGFLGVPERQRAGVLVTQELIDYPSAAQAEDAYPDIVQAEIPVKSWTWPEQIGFRFQADQIQVSCAQDVDSPETTSCRSVARYGNYVSIIWANVFEEQWLTMDDLERLLESVDARMAAARDQP